MRLACRQHRLIQCARMAAALSDAVILTHAARIVAAPLKGQPAAPGGHPAQMLREPLVGATGGSARRYYSLGAACDTTWMMSRGFWWVGRLRQLRLPKLGRSKVASAAGKQE